MTHVCVANLGYFLEQQICWVGDRITLITAEKSRANITHSSHCPTEVFTYLPSLKLRSFIGCSYKFMQLQWLQESKRVSVHVWWRAERKRWKRDESALSMRTNNTWIILFCSTDASYFIQWFCVSPWPIRWEHQILRRIWGEMACE